MRIEIQVLTCYEVSVEAEDRDEAISLAEQVFDADGAEQWPVTLVEVTYLPICEECEQNEENCYCPLVKVEDVTSPLLNDLRRSVEDFDQHHPPVAP